MQVRITEHNGRPATFQYTIDGETISGPAGELLCTLLNIDWLSLVNAYGCALSDEESYLVSAMEHFSQLPIHIQKMLGYIFPPTEKGLEQLKKLDAIVSLICKKITTKKTSYNYFLLVFTNFYDYKPPIIPIQTYEVSILSYLEPLIKEYCPTIICKSEYIQLVDAIKNVQSPTALWLKLLELYELLKKESVKHDKPNSVFDPQAHSFKRHCKAICDIIYLYCFDYVFKLCNFHNSEYDSKELSNHKDCDISEKMALDKLNKETNLSLIHRLYKKVDAPFESFLIELIFSQNEQRKKNVYHLENIFSLIFHAVLYCYEKSDRPISTCTYCHKFFRLENPRQEACRDCTSLTGNKKNAMIKEIFGVNLYGVVNNIYRRLCYGKHGKFSPGKYNVEQDSISGEMLLTQEESRILVEELKKLQKNLSKDVYAAYARYRCCQDSETQNVFIDLVNSWIQKIDEYYTLEKITELIMDAKSEAIANSLPHPIIKIKEIRFEIVDIIENTVTINLDPAKKETVNE